MTFYKSMLTRVIFVATYFPTVSPVNSGFDAGAKAASFAINMIYQQHRYALDGPMLVALAAEKIGTAKTA